MFLPAVSGKTPRFPSKKNPPKNWGDLLKNHEHEPVTEISKTLGPQLDLISRNFEYVGQFHNTFADSDTDKPDLLFMNRDNGSISLFHHVTTHLTKFGGFTGTHFFLEVYGLAHSDFLSGYMQLIMDQDKFLRKINLSVSFEEGMEPARQDFNTLFSTWNAKANLPNNNVKNEPPNADYTPAVTPTQISRRPLLDLHNTQTTTFANPENTIYINPEAADQFLFRDDESIDLFGDDESLFSNNEQQVSYPLDNEDTLFNDSDDDDAAYSSDAASSSDEQMELFVIVNEPVSHRIFPFLFCPPSLTADLLYYMSENSDGPVNSFHPNLVYNLAEERAKQLFKDAFLVHPQQPDINDATSYLMYLSPIKHFCLAASKFILPHCQIIPCCHQDFGERLRKWAHNLHDLQYLQYPSSPDSSEDDRKLPAMGVDLSSDDHDCNCPTRQSSNKRDLLTQYSSSNKHKKRHKAITLKEVQERKCTDEGHYHESVAASFPSRDHIIPNRPHHPNSSSDDDSFSSEVE